MYFTKLGKQKQEVVQPTRVQGKEQCQCVDSRIRNVNPSLSLSLLLCTLKTIWDAVLSRKRHRRCWKQSFPQFSFVQLDTECASWEVVDAFPALYSDKSQRSLLPLLLLLWLSHTHLQSPVLSFLNVSSITLLNPNRHFIPNINTCSRCNITTTITLTCPIFN